MKGFLEYFSARAPLVIVSVAVILPVVAYLEYRSNRENLDRMLYSKGLALMESVLHGAENAMLADKEITDQFADRLLDNARLIERMNRQGRLEAATLAGLAQADHLSRIDIYAADGALVLSSGRGTPPALPWDFKILPPGVAEDVAFVPGPVFDSADNSARREDLLAAIVKSVSGEAVVVCADLVEFNEIQRQLGIGLILDDLSAVEGVAYAVLQDTVGIIAASSQVAEIGSIRDDPFFRIPPGQVRGRYKAFSGEEIYELATGFQFIGENFGFLRIGLSTRELRSIADLDRKRVLMGMIGLIVMLGLGAGLTLAHQRHLHLEREHSRIKSFSDSVLESMVEAVVVTDHEGRAVVFNHACESLLKCQEDQVLGRRLSELNPALVSRLDELLRESPIVMEMELSCPGREQKFPVMISAAPLSVEGKRYTTVILSDLTDRKKAEELALRNEKYRAMAELAAGVAHEIRNPLNSIGMNVQRLKMEFTPESGDRAEYENFIEVVRSEVERINGIVEQFLTLARPLEPKKTLGLIHEVLEEAASFFQAELDARNIGLVREIAPSGQFYFDQGQIKQLLFNLAKNAAEAMGSGGTLTIRGREELNNYSITVQDTGPGIPGQDRERIFEPYFSTKTRGMGLGLAIVQRIVSEHQGAIRVDDSPGPGAAFEVKIPMKTKPERER